MNDYVLPLGDNFFPMSYIDEIIKNIPNGLYYLAVGWVVWQVARFYFIRFRDLEKKSDDISGISKKIDDKLEPTLIKINSTLDRISRYIITKDSLDPAFFSTNSPVELNALANELLEKSGGTAFVDNTLDFLVSKIEERNPKSILDIQQLAVSVIFDLVDTEAFSKIKDFVYQNPKYKSQDVDIPVIINIIALHLRNKYFEKHPELESSNQQ